MVVVYNPPDPMGFSPTRTERQAIELVMNYEKRQGRNPQDVSTKHLGYDIKSDERLIEVKGQKAKKPDFVYLYKRTLQKLGDNALRYYIYLVYDIKREPKLKILPPGKIFGNIEIEPMFLLRGKIFNGLEEIQLSGG